MRISLSDASGTECLCVGRSMRQLTAGMDLCAVSIFKMACMKEDVPERTFACQRLWTEP